MQYSYPRPSARRTATRFDEYYRCYPMVMAPGPDRPELNYGSKIFLPPSALDKVSKLHVQWPLQLELINGGKNKTTHAGVLEFVAEEGRAYIPQWMMETLALDVGDMIQIKTTSLELARLVKLQPQNVNFLDISDPRAVLEKAFRSFAALTKGDVFNFEYNDEIYHMAVLEVKPETPKMGVSMIETDVEVDFAPPVGYVEPARPAGNTAAATAGRPTHTTVYEHGSMAKDIGFATLAPSAPAMAEPAFKGAGHRLAAKKNSSGKTASGTVTPATGMAPVAGPANGAKPLRLANNVLFFGYEIKPVRTLEDKQREVEELNKPKFEGQGQTLRAKKK
ncbi:hypothetical protein TD95_002754 [Thielaviopsis punctulata]|uniref:Ubiquitin fusion degradation protein n=1 Tax=Thielaviopsis punctulata TaxID=72032 RepID=A0A0F4ZCW7_9PEZI|nr:hypothetical protein TD95_002754 [Thielaviopsis punctulata]